MILQQSEAKVDKKDLESVTPAVSCPLHPPSSTAHPPPTAVPTTAQLIATEKISYPPKFRATPSTPDTARGKCFSVST